MKIPRSITVCAIAAITMAAGEGCQNIRKMFSPPDETKTEQSEIRRSLSGDRNPPSLIDEELTAEEQEALRAHQHSGQTASPSYGPGSYDKDGQARKDWVFGL